MDLSFPPFDRDQELIAWPGDLAALMIGVAARQGASPTAIAQMLLAEPRPDTAETHLLQPKDGAFNSKVAAALTHWKDP